MQGYIVNEINLSKDGSCSKQCNDFDKIEQHSCDEDTGCSERRKCNGILRYCRELDDVHVCPTAVSYKERAKHWKSPLFDFISLSIKDVCFKGGGGVKTDGPYNI